MRQDLEALITPLEQEKHLRRRGALYSSFAIVSLCALLITTLSIATMDQAPIGAGIFFAVGFGAIGFQIGKLARWRDPVPQHWPILAVECRLSRDGRARLTDMLLKGAISCDEAIDWGRAERVRMIDDLRERAICRQRG